MKIQVHKEKILSGVQKAASIIPARTGAPFLRTIWLEAKDGSLKIMSTDSKFEFTGSYEAACQEPGLTGIQGKHFYDLFRRLPPGELQLRVDEANGTLLLEQGKRKYKLPTYDSSWFQHFSAFPEERAVHWRGDRVKDLIERVAYCISDDTTDQMHSMKLTPIEGESGIEACGLNGHQFALVRFENKELKDLIGEEGILIAKPYLLELRKWLDNEDIYFTLNESRLFFTNKHKNEQFSLPINANRFPSYDSFLSYFGQEENSLMTVNKEELQEALERLYIFNTETQRCSYFVFEDSELIIYSEGQDTGEATETMPIDFQGDLEKIVFPTKDLIDVLSHFDSETITFEFTTMQGPCKISGRNDGGYIVITMPVDISEETYYDEEEIE
jgi:DNA polymerase-3 subunit beta